MSGQSTMSPDRIANIRALADGGVSGPDDVLALCDALAAAGKALADERAGRVYADAPVVIENRTLRAEREAMKAREARLVGALREFFAALDEKERWVRECTRGQDAAKRWERAIEGMSAALRTPNATALAAAIEGVVTTWTAMGEHDDWDNLNDALNALRAAWRGA